MGSSGCLASHRASDSDDCHRHVGPKDFIENFWEGIDNAAVENPPPPVGAHAINASEQSRHQAHSSASQEQASSRTLLHTLA